MGLIISVKIVKILPSFLLYRFAKTISTLGYFIARRQRRIALESLTIAFGNKKSKQELKEIVRECFDYIAQSAVEMMFLMDRPYLLKERILLQGKEILDKALSAQRGVILVSAHFGNFPLMLYRLVLEGYKVAGIMRPMRDARVERIFLEKRNKLGIKTIYSQPRPRCVNETLKSLRNNEIVFIPLDQNFGTGGVFVDFFGRKAATATGPVIFAQRTKAAIIPCFIVRERDGFQKIIFESVLNLENGKDAQETILLNIQRITNIIERYIRDYPAQWGWIHRRWKSQPN